MPTDFPLGSTLSPSFDLCDLMVEVAQEFMSAPKPYIIAFCWPATMPSPPQTMTSDLRTSVATIGKYEHLFHGWCQGVMVSGVLRRAEVGADTVMWASVSACMMSELFLDVLVKRRKKSSDVHSSCLSYLELSPWLKTLLSSDQFTLYTWMTESDPVPEVAWWVWVTLSLRPSVSQQKPPPEGKVGNLPTDTTPSQALILFQSPDWRVKYFLEKWNELAGILQRNRTSYIYIYIYKMCVCVFILRNWLSDCGG